MQCQSFVSYISVAILDDNEKLANLNSGVSALLSLASIARCIPSSCTESDLSTSFNLFLQKNSLGYSVPFIQNCHTAEEETELMAEDWVMVGIISFFALLTIIGTLVDISCRYFSNAFCTSKHIQVLQGFSLYSNTLMLLSTQQPKADALPCINGIRFMSTAWIIILHVYGKFKPIIAPPVVDTLTFNDPTGPFYGNILFFAILSPNAVDSFFFIGSTLLSYLHLYQLDKYKGGNVKFWFKYYVHRYIRLTGVYAVCIGLTSSLFKFLATGPSSFIVTYQVKNCKENWWKNLLYINNYNDIKEACFAHAWYLAVDFQFYLISPIFLLAFWYKPLVGWLINSSAMLAATITPMVVAYKYELPFAVITMPFEVAPDYISKFYTVPWCRFQPYIGGIMFGYILHRLREQLTVKLNIIFVISLWALFSAMGASVIFSLFPLGKDFMESGGTDMVGSLAGRVLYSGLHRLAWSLWLGWIILACTKNVGGPVNSFLSWPVWIPFARLSYLIYLVHFPIIDYLKSILTFNVYFTHTFAVFFFLATLVVSSLLSFVLYILFEIPIAYIEKIMFSVIID